MSQPVIRVSNLGKKYRIGEVHEDLLSERIGNGLRRLQRVFLPDRRVRKGTPDTKSEREFWALRGVDFEVHQGEVVGIIGRNGAGKSTLLKILSRITTPTSGKAELFGRVGSLLEVGTGFHPELTGRENVYLNGAILGMSRAEIRKKFDEIVAFAEVEKFVDTPVKRYSSGMYVRLAFAVAAHLEPDILIVDEVLAVGDVQFQKKCLGKMGDVAREGRTVLFVSHNMASIKRLCESVMLLSKGQIAEKGPAGTVIAGYLREDLTENALVELPEEQHLTRSCLQIRNVEILNSRKRPSPVIPLGEDLHIRLGIQATEPSDKVRVGIGVCTEGIRLSTFHTPPFDIQKSLKSRYIICRIVGNTLLPNFYTLQLGAYSTETGRELDWVADAASFSIADVSTSLAHESDEKEVGLVRLNAIWEGELLS